jgi:hypothetical protein
MMAEAWGTVFKVMRVIISDGFARTANTFSQKMVRRIYNYIPSQNSLNPRLAISEKNVVESILYSS